MLGGSIHEGFCTSEMLCRKKSHGQSQTLNGQKLLKTICQGLHVLDEKIHKKYKLLYSKHTPLLTKKPESYARFATGKRKEIREYKLKLKLRKT